MIEKIRKVLVVGAGTMGAQISLDCALAGYDVTVWDVSDQALESLEQRQRIWAGWQIEKGAAAPEEAAKAVAGIRKTADVGLAAEDADLLIEAVFEEINAKRNVFAQFEDLCPAKTIFTTNTSTLLPRDMEPGVRRRAQFSAFHFNWPKTVIEIMRGSETSDETVELLREFARSIGYLPIYIQKEYPGFIHAALFGAWAITGVQLAAKGVASIEDIDRAWMRGDDAPFGPLGALDAVGLDLVMMILAKMKASGAPGFDYEEMSSFLKGYIDRGELGVKTGKGFYSYPDPAFRRDGFLK
jgi:3-hydroxybutyryl-CoA dehydrogenase